ncbi:hypothetical protein M426DRAFT_319902 [Hypoxylon sp. CI-4A]|nr:hypothetical protein M426DRAFT_319902 [Hypoxylon sp. CI-4A]
MASNGGPAYGRRLLPRVLDERAEKDPCSVYASIPKTTDVKDGFRDVTVADFARCVDSMAHWFEGKFGRSDTFETITYIGLSDLRGPATFLGAVKAGYKLLVPSPRNPPSTNAWLMKETGSTKLLYTPELAPLIKPLQSLAPSVDSYAVPSFQEMLDSNAEPYPYMKSFDEARNDPIVVLHSSGSTGLPKPIIITHGSMAAHDNDHNLPAPPGREKLDSTALKLDGETRLYVILPFFHLGGFVFLIHHAIFNSVTIVIGPAHVAPDVDLLKEIAAQQKLHGVMIIPALLEQLLHDASAVELIKKLEYLATAGAPLPGAVGDCVKDLVKRLFVFIGSTETFPLPELYKSRDDWIYHEFNPHLKHEMQLYDPTVGTYELVLFADDSNKDSAPLYHNLPGVNPFYTKDLFTQHPEKPALYKYYGRKDDILVLANGEKVNPIPFEQHVQGHPSVNGAVVIGTGRIQSALLLEPKESLNEAGRASFLETLWPRISESNAHIPGQGRVARDKVICASPDKPFPRTGKGTIIRKLTEDAFKDEIEELYSGSMTEIQDRTSKITLEGTVMTIYEPAKIITFLRQVFSISFAPAVTIDEDEEFVAHGLDSLQTLEITANLKRILGELTPNSVTWITPRTIFRHSTLADLAKLLATFLNDGIVLPEDSQTNAVDDAVARHTKDLPARAASQAVPSSGKITVALISSTGYLGSHLVAALLRNPEVEKVYCLNRSLGDLDKSLEPFLHKVVYLHIRIGEPRLGLKRQENWDKLANEVDVIIYNAWRLDFGLAIRSFDPFLKATRDLIELSLASKRNMRVVFVSSISSVENLAINGGVPETPVEDASAAMNTGYGQSKLAAERILVTANRQSGVPVSIARVGQIGGSSLASSGTWTEQPWISAIIRTSTTLGHFPSQVAPIDWVPIDTVVEMLQSFSLQPAQEDPQVYNIASPAPQPWSLLFDAVCELGLVEESRLKTIPLREWVNRLRDIADPSPEDVASLPALKLLDFYDTLGDGAESLSIATDHAREVSGVEVPTIDTELLASWLKYWDL